MSTTSIVEQANFFSAASAEKRSQEGKIGKALIATGSVALLVVISAIALAFIPLLSPIVWILMGAMFTAVALIGIPLLVVFIYDYLITTGGDIKDNDSMNTIIKDSQEEIKDNPDKVDGFLDEQYLEWLRDLKVTQNESNCRLTQAERFPVGDIFSIEFAVIRHAYLESKKKTSDLMKLILNCDHSSKVEFDSRIIGLNKHDLGELVERIRESCDQLQDHESSKSTKLVLDSLIAAIELLARQDNTNLELGKARVIFNIIYKIKTKRSDDDHQMVKEQYNIIDKIFAYAKFLLGNALLKVRERPVR
jgi:hypothetical protein